MMMSRFHLLVVPLVTLVLATGVGVRPARAGG